MSGIKQNIESCINVIIAQHDADIKRMEYQKQFHLNKAYAIEKEIETLKLSKTDYLNHLPYRIEENKINSTLTRELIRSFMKGGTSWIRTVDVIDLIYKDQSEEERTRLIKTLSVIFNQMAENDEIEIKKQSGIKGNLYRWNYLRAV